MFLSTMLLWISWSAVSSPQSIDTAEFLHYIAHRPPYWDAVGGWSSHERSVLFYDRGHKGWYGAVLPNDVYAQPYTKLDFELADPFIEVSSLEIDPNNKEIDLSRSPEPDAVHHLLGECFKFHEAFPEVRKCTVWIRAPGSQIAIVPPYGEVGPCRFDLDSEKSIDAQAADPIMFKDRESVWNTVDHLQQLPGDLNSLISLGPNGFSYSKGGESYFKSWTSAQEFKVVTCNQLLEIIAAKPDLYPGLFRVPRSEIVHLFDKWCSRIAFGEAYWKDELWQSPHLLLTSTGNP